MREINHLLKLLPPEVRGTETDLLKLADGTGQRVKANANHNSGRIKGAAMTGNKDAVRAIVVEMMDKQFRGTTSVDMLLNPIRSMVSTRRQMRNAIRVGELNDDRGTYPQNPLADRIRVARIYKTSHYMNSTMGERCDVTVDFLRGCDELVETQEMHDENYLKTPCYEDQPEMKQRFGNMQERIECSHYSMSHMTVKVSPSWLRDVHNRRLNGFDNLLTLGAAFTHEDHKKKCKVYAATWARRSVSEFIIERGTIAVYTPDLKQPTCVSVARVEGHSHNDVVKAINNARRRFKVQRGHEMARISGALAEGRPVEDIHTLFTVDHARFARKVDPRDLPPEGCTFKQATRKPTYRLEKDGRGLSEAFYAEVKANDSYRMRDLRDFRTYSRIYHRAMAKSRIDELKAYRLVPPPCLRSADCAARWSGAVPIHLQMWEGELLEHQQVGRYLDNDTDVHRKKYQNYQRMISMGASRADRRAAIEELSSRYVQRVVDCISEDQDRNESDMEELIKRLHA